MPNIPKKFQKEPSTTEELLSRYSTKNGYPVIPWTDVQGNKFLTAIHPMMLDTDGYLQFKQARLTGQRNWEQRVQCFVYFNREYVIQKLSIHFIELKCLGFNEIQKVLSEVWAFCKHIDSGDNF